MQLSDLIKGERDAVSRRATGARTLVLPRESMGPDPTHLQHFGSAYQAGTAIRISSGCASHQRPSAAVHSCARFKSKIS